MYYRAFFYYSIAYYFELIQRFINDETWYEKHQEILTPPSLVGVSASDRGRQLIITAIRKDSVDVAGLITVVVLLVFVYSDEEAKEEFMYTGTD